MNKRVTCCVTNDLRTDQRMDRICSSLQRAGYAVTLIGRQRPGNLPLAGKDYDQHRLPMWFSRGKAFYIEYNIRLFFYLLFRRADILVAVDLDTIVPVYYASRLLKAQRVYDAHELFTELKEVVSRPQIHRVWSWVERRFLPRFPNGYTVSASIARHFQERYGVSYALIRNLPQGGSTAIPLEKRERFFLYQGAVNEGRGFEWLIPAMQWVDAPLHIYGEGNFTVQCQQLITKYQLAQKVVMKGAVTPEALRGISSRAYAGVNLIEPLGLNQVYSLANKFFDYIQAGLPQVTMDFPEYRAVNSQFRVAVLLPDLKPENIAAAMNKLWRDEVFYADMSANCVTAAEVLSWEHEENRLIQFYQTING